MTVIVVVKNNMMIFHIPVNCHSRNRILTLPATVCQRARALVELLVWRVKLRLLCNRYDADGEGATQHQRKGARLVSTSLLPKESRLGPLASLLLDDFFLFLF